MKLTRLLAVTLLTILVAFNCTKKRDVPTPVAPPPIPKPAEPVKEDPKPVVEVDESADSAEEVKAEIPKFEGIYFDFDKSNLRPEERGKLNRYAEVLKANPGLQILIEGHCDERGTEEYNLGLGERRAQSAKEYLVNLGIAENRIRTISYGEMQPKAEGHNEEAWALNRRAHFNLSR